MVNACSVGVQNKDDALIVPSYDELRRFNRMDNTQFKVGS